MARRLGRRRSPSSGRAHIPYRHHLRPEAPAAELTSAGFELVWQGGPLGGVVICRTHGTGETRQMRDVVEWINRESGRRYELRHRFPVGTEGAWLVEGPSSGAGGASQLVLKLEPDVTELEPLLECLRDYVRAHAVGYCARWGAPPERMRRSLDTADTHLAELQTRTAYRLKPWRR